MSTNTHPLYVKFSRGHCHINADGDLICVSKCTIKAWPKDAPGAQDMLTEVMSAGRPISKNEFESAFRKAVELIAGWAGMKAHAVALEVLPTLVQGLSTDPLPENHKPWLTPGSRDWENAIAGLEKGITSIPTIRTTMRISKAIESRLLSEVAFLTHHKGL